MAQAGPRIPEDGRKNVHIELSEIARTGTTPNADSLKFISGTPVMETGSAEFLDARITFGKRG